MVEKSNLPVEKIFRAKGLRRTELSSIFSHMQPQVQTPKPEGRPAKHACYPPAIEISSTAVKLLQLARTQNRGYEIAKCAYMPFDAEGPHAYPSQDAIRKNLSRLVKAEKLEGEVAGLLPINRIQVMTITLPNMPSGEIEEAISWKLKQNPPAGATFDGISFDYSAVSYSKDDLNRELRALVFIVSKEVVLAQMNLFKEFSLELAAVEPKPYAVLNGLVWLGKAREDETVLIIQLGASHSSICIARGGQPYLIRPLSVSGGAFTEAISSYHQLDRPKAVSEKMGGTELVRPALSSQLENLAVDIEHTFKYFSHQITRSEVGVFDRIIVSGGTSRLKILTEFLAERLSVPVEAFDPLSSIASSSSCEKSPAVLENSASFDAALGLAVRSVEW